MRRFVRAFAMLEVFIALILFMILIYASVSLIQSFRSQAEVKNLVRLLLNISQNSASLLNDQGMGGQGSAYEQVFTASNGKVAKHFLNAIAVPDDQRKNARLPSTLLCPRVGGSLKAMAVYVAPDQSGINHLVFVTQVSTSALMPLAKALPDDIALFIGDESSVSISDGTRFALDKLNDHQASTTIALLTPKGLPTAGVTFSKSAPTETCL
jgi:type II secretory pathway pseudopilin PulG